MLDRIRGEDREYFNGGLELVCLLCPFVEVVPHLDVVPLARLSLSYIASCPSLWKCYPRALVGTLCFFVLHSVRHFGHAEQAPSHLAAPSTDPLLRVRARSSTLHSVST